MQSSDYNDVVAGCTRGNAMLCSLGAGTGSKASRALFPLPSLSAPSLVPRLSALPCRAAPQATAMYLIRYAYKGSASLQLDAHTHQQE